MHLATDQTVKALLNTNHFHPFGDRTPDDSTDTGIYPRGITT
jgi:hypothetical protein